MKNKKGEDCLDLDEFMDFYHYITTRDEVEDLFQKFVQFVSIIFEIFTFSIQNFFCSIFAEFVLWIIRSLLFIHIQSHIAPLLWITFSFFGTNWTVCYECLYLVY